MSIKIFYFDGESCKLVNDWDIFLKIDFSNESMETITKTIMALEKEGIQSIYNFENGEIICFKKVDSFYFGAKDKENVGHYLYDAKMEKVDSKEAPFTSFFLDSDDRLSSIPKYQEHLGQYEIVDEEWSILAFWDTSADSRPNSKSIFIAKTPDISLARLVWTCFFKKKLAWCKDEEIVED